jgi:hypothetical protein
MIRHFFEPAEAKISNLPHRNQIMLPFLWPTGSEFPDCLSDCIWSNRGHNAVFNGWDQDLFWPTRGHLLPRYPQPVYVLHQLWNPKPFSLPHSFLSGGNGFQIRTAKSETAGQQFNLLQQSGFGHSPERRPAYAQ